jgi:Tol biopolymer transport system component
MMIGRGRCGLLALAIFGSCLGALFVASGAYAGTSPALLGFDDGSAGVYEAPFGADAQPTLVAPAGIYPQFSPNGTELAYNLERSSDGGTDLTNSIVIADRTGAGAKDLITGPTEFNGDVNSVLYPFVWSPNGKEIAYGCDGGVDYDPSDTSIPIYEWEQVCIVDVATGAHHLLTDPKTDKDPAAAVGLDERWSWTPNGKEIIATVDQAGPCISPYSFTFGCGSASIGAIDADSGATSVLTKSTEYDSQTSPSVSPDGKQILFHFNSSLQGTSGLEIMSAGGGDQRAFDTGGLSTAAGAIFSPDGKDVFFTALPAVDPYYVQAFEIPVTGGTPKQLLNTNYALYDLTATSALTTCTVPNLKQKTLAQAKKLLKKAACALGKVSGPKSHRNTRRIVKQSLKANSDHPAGTKVNVTLR